MGCTLGGKRNEVQCPAVSMRAARNYFFGDDAGESFYPYFFIMMVPIHLDLDASVFIILHLYIITVNEK